MAQRPSEKPTATAPFTMVEQAEQLGTGHAVQATLGQLREQAKVVILYGDVPLITPATIVKMLAAVDQNHIASAHHRPS